MWKKGKSYMVQKEKGKRSLGCVFQPYPPPSYITHTLSFLLLPEIPFSASPQKIPSSSHSFKGTIFMYRIMRAFYVSLCFGQSFTEKPAKFKPFLYFLSFSFSYNTCLVFWASGLLSYLLVWWRRWKRLCLLNLLMLFMRIIGVSLGIKVCCRTMKSCRR